MCKTSEEKKLGCCICYQASCLCRVRTVGFFIIILCPCGIFLLVPLCSLTIFFSPVLGLYFQAEGEERLRWSKGEKHPSPLPPAWTSVSVILAAAPSVTPPDGEPAGSAEVLPTEMAEITPLEWSPTLVFCTVPYFVVESVTTHHIDCHLPSPWPCDSSEEEAFGL